jgi:hypothetical protein
MCKSFKKGVLYVRVHDGAVAEFFYPDEAEVPSGYSNFHCQHIARIHWGIGEPEFGGWVDTSHNGECTGSGMLIEFYKATDDDIKNLLATWKSRVSIAEWVKDIKEENPNLSAKEKDRIARIASPYIN